MERTLIGRGRLKGDNNDISQRACVETQPKDDNISYANVFKKKGGAYFHKVDGDGRPLKVLTYNFAYNSDVKEVAETFYRLCREGHKKRFYIHNTSLLSSGGVFSIRAIPLGMNLILLVSEDECNIKDVINEDFIWVQE
ncbi:hypothetical protein VNO78_15151 [Psophocarpus tetragonolobus]|uniref:Uncharacterized protein n=1 Tax=Psophocarpus tetragonolobus TaxID=3891 RepID=A0AAN9XJM8_PSOTE